MKCVSLENPQSTAHSRPPRQWTPYVSPTTAQAFTPMAYCVEEVCIYQVLLFEAMAPLSDTL
jgi:hypothetical protein